MINIRNLRCSILAVGDFPEGGAVSQRLHLLAKLLNEGLGETTLWILHPTSKQAVRENCATAGILNGVKFQYLSGTTVRPSSTLGALIDTVKGIYKSLRLISNKQDSRPDVLVVYTPGFIKFIVPMLLAKLLRIPLVVESCEIPSQSIDILQVGRIRRWANSGELYMERLIPRLAAGLLVISNGIKNYYQKLGLDSDAAYLLPVLIDAERYEAKGSPVESLNGQRYLLNSGSFSEKDGLSFLVSAIAEVHQQHPDIKLVFTGSAAKPIQEKIVAMAGANSADWIVFTGFLTRDELIWCYKNAVGLLSCRSNSSYANYGFPTKLAEYLITGSPVVATTVGDTEGYLTDGENAFLAEPENVESIASAISRLLEDPVSAKVIGMNGSKVARHFFDYRNHIEAVSTFIQQRIGVTE